MKRRRFPERDEEDVRGLRRHRSDGSPEGDRPVMDPVPDDAHGLDAAGNRLVGHLLGRTEGRRLDPVVRRRMEGALGADLDAVRIHTDQSAASAVRRHGAEAMTVGEHVLFDADRYQPGTSLGDALIAHELAHTLQQRDPSWGEGGGASAHRLEVDANRSALHAVGAMWGSSTQALAGAFADVGTRVRSGTQMQFFFCEGKPAYKAPDYLGEHSLQALADINRIAEAGRALGPLIVIGTVLTQATSSPGENLASGSYDITPQANALRAIPVIVRSRIIDVVGLLLVQHENKMNEKERMFWRNILRELNAL